MKQNIGIRVDENIAARLEIISEQYGVTVSTQCNEIITAYVNNVYDRGYKKLMVQHCVNMGIDAADITPEKYEELKKELKALSDQAILEIGLMLIEADKKIDWIKDVLTRAKNEN